MESSLYRMYSENKPTILLGDINIDLLSEKVDKLKTSWIELTTAMGLTQIIKTLTRETDNTKTLIDHIYVNNDLPVLHSVPINYGISDHFPVFAVPNLKNNSKISNKTHKQMSYRTYKTFNPDASIADLQTMPQTNINTTSHTTDECLESFPCTFSNIINTHLPHVTKRIKRPKQSTWITKDILLSMNKRDNSMRMNIDTGGTRRHI